MSACSRWLEPIRQPNISISWHSFRNTDDKDLNPWQERVRLRDRESLSKSQLFNVWVCNGTSGAKDGGLVWRYLRGFWTALNKLSKPSVWACGLSLINIATEWKCHKRLYEQTTMLPQEPEGVQTFWSSIFFSHKKGLISGLAVSSLSYQIGSKACDLQSAVLHVIVMFVGYPVVFMGFIRKICSQEKCEWIYNEARK